MDYEIVPLSEEHYDGWLSIFKEYLDFSNIKVSDKQIKNSWEMMLGNYKMQGCLVSICEEKVVGFLGYSFHTCLSNGIYICTAEAAYVLKDYRRFGIYKNFFSKLEGVCKEKTIPAIRLYAHDTNQSVQKYMETYAMKTGFLQYQKSVDLS